MLKQLKSTVIRKVVERKERKEGRKKESVERLFFKRGKL